MDNKNGQGGKKIIIAERDNIAAIMEGKKVTEFYIHRGEVLLGDIYLATVENILPSIDAAFVDVGVDKMGFLHAQDVMGKGSLKDKLSPKQKLVVQVVKEPTGHKGPRVTTEISLPGRFLVLIPNETGINVSRKIDSPKEKARLKSVVSLLKPVGVGVIVRTEAEGQSEADIQEDLELLLEKWNNIITSADSLTPPSLISRDQDLLYRVLREACTDNISEILVDTTFAMNRVQQLLQNWHMNKNIEVSVYKGTEPLLVATDIHKEIKTALQSKVNMPSGGYLYIQTTEALTVVDVNSGKFISSATQDETILRTNKEAVVEIARQLRLRNIGGMIIVDFIDMTSRVDKLAILEEFELALEPDKSKPQIGQISDLGLVELTRHRQGQSLAEIFTKKCPHCQGNGYIMEDFAFSSPTAEGEYRAKAAKLKIPVGGFKKNNNNNNFKKPFNNQQGGQQGGQQGPQQNLPSNLVTSVPSNLVTSEQVASMAEGAVVSQGEAPVQPQENKNRNRRPNNRFNKNRSQEGTVQQLQTGETPSAEAITEAKFAPKFEQKVAPKVEPKMETPAEIKKPGVSTLPPLVFEAPKPAAAKSESVKAEAVVEEKAEKEVKAKPKAPARRPNRNTAKKPKATGVENEETPKAE